MGASAQNADNKGKKRLRCMFMGLIGERLWEGGQDTVIYGIFIPAYAGDLFQRCTFLCG